MVYGGRSPGRVCASVAAGLLLAGACACGKESTGDGPSSSSAGSGGATGGVRGSDVTGATGGSMASGASGSGTSGVTGADAGAGAGCSFQGQVYADGASFPAGDGCNTCRCSGATVECTARGCDPDDAGLPSGGAGGAEATGGSGGELHDAGSTDAGAACEYQGQTYPNGAQFAAGDGCNQCGCTNGMVQCTALWCPDDAGSDAAPADAGEVDSRMLDVWYFDIPTGLVRWYQLALCVGGRALVWTSFQGTGEPDQASPIQGTWQGSGLKVTVLYDDLAVEGGPESMVLEYIEDSDYIQTISVDGAMPWGASTGVRLAPLSSVTFRLSCD